MGAIAQEFERADSPPIGVLLNQREWKRVVASLGLSPQQARIAALILEGKPDKQIAAQLEIALGTVRTYLSRMFERTGAAGRIELAMRMLACANALRERGGVLNHDDSKAADGGNDDLH